jgi:hypothetical protein
VFTFHAQKAFIVDTGSSVSLIQPGVSSSEINTTSVLPIGVTGDALQIQGEQEVKLCINGTNIHHRFKVCSLPTEAHGILGTDYLAKVNACLDLENKKLVLKLYPDHATVFQSRCVGKATKMKLLLQCSIPETTAQTR